MKRFAFCLMLLGGCASYTQVQLDLVEQARKGVALCTQSSADRGQYVRQLQLVQRQRLDEAFDADARAAAKLSADWVIEARKAYAIALDALAKQQAASLEAESADKRNLAAVDQALQKLYWLQTVQLQWALPGGISK